MLRTQILLLLGCAIFIASCGDSAKKNQTNAVTSTFQTTVLNANIPSPKKELKGVIGTTKITVVYGSPSVKGRTVYGSLVPYDQVWRTGANEATTVELSEAVKIDSKNLPAGKYALFTIPTATSWTVIFNSVSDQWGAYDYSATKDVLRAKATPQATTTSSETLEFNLDGPALVMQWENLKLPIAMTVK